MLRNNELTETELGLFSALIYEATRIKIDSTKKVLLANRFAKRMEALKLAGFRDYYNFLLKAGPAHPEFIQFINSVTTNETYFFRAPKIWQHLTSVLLAGHYKASPKKPLAMWCAAASSGEEPYTIAILCEEFASKNPGFSWSLKASDISTDMLARCKAGSYKGRAVETVEPRLREKYFDAQDDGGLTVKAALRSKVQFFRHRLQDPVPPGKYDIIFLRNVMIYFDNPTKAKILGQMDKALVPGGTLVVGEAEGLVGVETSFKYVCPSVYAKGRQP